MIDNETDLRAILNKTALASAPVARINIPNTPESAFVVRIAATDPLHSWAVMRELVAQTGRWPVLFTLWGRTDTWKETVSLVEEVFSNRFEFGQELMRTKGRGDRPADILAASITVDVESKLQEIDRRCGEFDDLEEILPIYLEETRDRFGTAPEVGEPVSFLLSEKIHSRAELQRWLFNWERQHCADALAIGEGELDYLQWFDSDSPSLVLLLMPSDRHWEIPAYLSWFASDSASSELVVALMREWHLRYGTELVAHHGTMLELTTSRLPSSPEEAFHLAWQQETIAQSTTSPAGVSLRDHARAMLKTNRWFLHARP